MWREETGFLEMFLAYYSQFEENMTEKKAYRDFLMEVLCAHERSITAVASLAAASVGEAFVGLSLPEFVPGTAAHIEEAEEEEAGSLEKDCFMPDDCPTGQRMSNVVFPEPEPQFPFKVENDVEDEVRFLGASEFCLKEEDQRLPASSCLNLVESSAVDLTDENDDQAFLFGGGSNFATAPPMKREFSDGDKPRRFVCQICDRQFTTTGSLQRHKRIHTGARPYVCKVCNKTFNVSTNLQTHLRIHTGERPFACKFCHKAFNDRSNLRKHERIHTGEKLYVCSVCQRSFAQKSALQTHERTHTAERPFLCLTCNKSFASNWHLQRHQRLHEGAKAPDENV